MPKKANEVGALGLNKEKYTKAGRYSVGGVAGLYLKVSPSGARSWVLRVIVGNKRRDMGLGGFPDVTLAQARDKARQVRADLEKGIDPIAARNANKSALIAARNKEITFEKAATLFIDTKSLGWKNAKHTAQWSATLKTYAYPIIGKMQVKDIESPHILKILEPIWGTKTETASRLRGRIEQVIDWTIAARYIAGENPAKWQGRLDKLLPHPSKVAKIKHHPAMAYTEIGKFMADLRHKVGVSVRLLEFTILTAVRSGEARGATWAEIDLDAGVWTIPAERMKAKKEHRVPLSEPALKILREMPRIDDGALVFQAPRGGMLSDMAMTAIMRRMGQDTVPHGFRSTFRDWCAECTNYPREVAEMALAHAIDNKVEAAYRRGDLFEKRARLMAEWAKFCGTISLSAEVISLNKKVSA
ncbi:tyrosine-type recombinase/integrase [Parvibium lacunae]|uniref:Site-specific integrase n=1 Tax=Parvibium lacunae TaxID=1888893 RepID=A0A368L7B7_9BURK|nr:site-specific integrase [Parvibium lacunae]RCS59588.1 site-specific integrase [Parvibium lacunae]